MTCPACESNEAMFLGTLGKHDHFRCRHCGLDYSSTEISRDWEESGEWNESDA